MKAFATTGFVVFIGSIIVVAGSDTPKGEHQGPMDHIGILVTTPENCPVVIRPASPPGHVDVQHSVDPKDEGIEDDEISLIFSPTDGGVVLRLPVLNEVQPRSKPVSKETSFELVLRMSKKGLMAVFPGEVDDVPLKGTGQFDASADTLVLVAVPRMGSGHAPHNHYIVVGYGGLLYQLHLDYAM